MKMAVRIFLVALCLIGTINSAFSQSADQQTLGASGYPLPRFMSLDDDITNMRTGPGLEYPIDWIYQKEDYPLKVIAEYGNWFKVMDMDGSTGWILRHLLSLSRRGIIINGPQKLIKSPSDEIVTVIAEQNVLGSILQCQNDWCEMDVGGFTGWIRSENVWGTLDQEIFD